MEEMLPQFTTMNVIDGQAGLVSYSSLIFYSLTIDNILNIMVAVLECFTRSLRVAVPTAVMASARWWCCST